MRIYCGDCERPVFTTMLEHIEELHPRIDVWIKSLDKRREGETEQT